MQTRVGASPAYVLSQLTTAIAGAACFVASIAFINSAKTALFEPVFTFSPADYFWLSSLRVDVDHGTQFPQTIQAPSIDALVPTDVNVELKKISRLEAHAKRERKKTWAHLARLQMMPNISVGKSASQLDTLQVTAAAPIQSEVEKMQRVHAALIAQFHLSLNEAAPSSTTTQVAEVLNTHAHAASVPQFDEAPEAFPSEETVKEDKIHMTSSSAAIPGARPVDGLGVKVDQQVDRAGGLEDFSVPPGIGEEAIRAFPVAFAQVENSNPQAQHSGLQMPARTQINTEVKAEPPTLAEKPPENTGTLTAPPALSETVTLHGTTIILPPAFIPPPAQAGYPQAKPMPAQPEYSPRVVSSTTPLVTPATQAMNSHGVESTHASSLPLLSATIDPSPVITFIEAFDWNHSVTDAQAEILSREDSIESLSPSRQGWRIAHSPDHWPSFYWNQTGEVPMLSQNSAKMLSLKMGTPIQNEAGIVIAKCPVGWSLEFSGRAEHPMIFSESNQLLLSDSTDEERFYVFLNASPGAQIVYLVKDGETGAVTLPVFGGTLSYADLTQPVKKSIMGKVLDTSGRSARGFPGIQVQLIGSGQTAMTNERGVFRFDHVVTLGNQSLFIEAKSNSGFPHRYKINPKNRNPSLYFMGEEQIHDWVGQLDGGISSESGLIVGALPSLASVNEALQPLPSVKSMALDPTLSPETYTVSGTGQLLVKTPLNESNSRLLGVQVPEGPALVQLTDKDGTVLWSELLVVSPRVLSVVGPY